MEQFEIFETLPEGFRLATEEDLPLVNLTLAQAFADYKYPIPSVEISHSALLRYYYEISDTCAKNALKNGVVLTNDDFSAVMLITPFELRADYGPDSLYQNLLVNSGKEAAENMLKIFDYICENESKVVVDDGTLFVDMFAVQTPKQGQKLGSRLMRELFNECEKQNRDVFLYTNTEKNKDIYNHFGFDTVLTVNKDDIKSDTYYLVWKSPKKKINEIKKNIKISSVYPMYYSKKENLDKTISSFIDLGYEKLHHFKYDDNSEGYVLGNDAGSKMDVFANPGVDAQEGLYGMRINVDNLDEAINFTKNAGYQILSDVIVNKSNRSIFTKNPNGMNCYFIEHIKNKTVTNEEDLKKEIFESDWYKQRNK